MKPTAAPIETLTIEERDAMFALLNRCFHGVTRDIFESDLDEKTIAIRLHDQAGRLLGFSTLAFYFSTDVAGEPTTIVCSGDTIVDPDAWGSSALSRAWIGVALDWHAQHGVGELYWLLITSGYRTYRFLPVFFKSFYPHLDHPIPNATADWMHRLATERWGRAYHRRDGVVRFDRPQRLRGTLADVPDERRRDPHVAHFLSLNPGHTAGDELVSVCRLDADNLTRAGERMVRDSIRLNVATPGLVS